MLRRGGGSFVAAARYASRGGPIPRNLRAKSTAPAGGTSTTSGGRGPVTWAALVGFGAVGTGLVAYYAREKERQMEEVMKPRSVGRASIGGPFKLINGDDGKEVTEELLKGRWTLIYFGFVQCPDICPAELSKIGEALNILEKKGIRVTREENTQLQPIFISIDPERDSPEKSAEYAQCFHDSFMGLSGTLEDVKATAKGYRVYYSKDDEEKEDYLVDHSIITYLMDPSGEFSEFYAKNASAVEVAARIQAKMMTKR